MENLAYLHCASAYDEAPAIESTLAEDTTPLFDGLDWKKLSGKACIALLPFAIVLGMAASMPQQAQAGGCYTKYTSCKVHYRVVHRPKYYVKRYRVTIHRPVYRYKYYPVYKHIPVVVHRPKFIHVTYPVAIPRPRYYYKDFPVVIPRPKYYHKSYKVVHQPSCFDDWDSGCGKSFESVGFHPTPAPDYNHDNEFEVYNGGCDRNSCSG